MPWYYVLLLIGAVIAPFDALYVYIKAQRRREALRRGRAEQSEKVAQKKDTPSP